MRHSETRINPVETPTSPCLLSPIEPEDYSALIPSIPRHDQIAKLIPAQGIYMGVWKIVRNPNYSGATRISDNLLYCLFASPKDLSDKEGNQLLTNFEDAAHEVGNMTSLGHRGTYIRDPEILGQKLIQDALGGRWVLPPLELLCSPRGQSTYATSMIALKNTGDFANTFVMDKGGKHPNAHLYGSISHVTAMRIGDIMMCDIWICDMSLSASTECTGAPRNTIKSTNYQISHRPCRMVNAKRYYENTRNP